MRRPAAGGVGACGVDGGAALLNVNDLPFLIHHERGAVRHAVLRHENTICGGHFTVEEITQQGERRVELGGEFLLGGSVVGTNAKNFGIVAFKFCNTSLVCGDFAGSTTGKSGWKKCQYHGIFSAEAGQHDLSALSGRQTEVGRHVPFLQKRMGRLDVLGEEAHREQSGRERKRYSHSH